MLLAALYEMFTKDGIGAASKQEVIQRIKLYRWFEMQDEDLKPYQSQRHLSGEPRWHTLIAWARKDGVLRDLVSYEARDAWGLTRSGRDAFERFRDRCAEGKKPVSDCFLWSIDFKRHLKPDFQPHPNDKMRPTFFYRDTIPDLLAGWDP